MSYVRQCPSCGSTYSPREGFCIADGSPLSDPVWAVAANGHETPRVRRETVISDQETHVFPRQTEEWPDLAQMSTEELRREQSVLWLEAQRSWLRLSALMLAPKVSDPDEFAAERDDLDQILDQFDELSAQLVSKME